MKLRPGPACWLLLLLPLALPAAGCKDPGETGPLLVLSPERLDFGEVPVDSAVAQTLSLRNAGDAALDLLSVSLAEGELDTWSVEWPGASTLAGGQQAEVTVVFSPQGEGAGSGALRVRSSVSTVEVALAGTGGPSETDADGDGFSAADGDCDDDRAEVYPGAEEACDGLDTDCDGALPAEEADQDGDGVRLCGGDCDDGDRHRYPGAEEVCDDLDNDCDGKVQDRLDQDGDGVDLCGGDCDDGDGERFPGNAEVCDYLDNDCNDAVDDLDADGDGFSACDSGGDCDDADADAFPVLVDAAAPEGGDGSAAAPFARVEDALPALDLVCRTVILRPGTYPVELSWADGALTLAGGAEDPAEVVLTTPEGSAARVLEVSGGAQATLRDLWVVGAASSADGGALRADGASLALSGVTLQGNGSGGDGGAVAVSSGTLSLSGCTFLENVAGDDGGAVAAVSSTVSDEGSVYLDNQGARGGAVVWQATSGRLVDGTMQGNVASADGGAIWLVGGGGLTLERLSLWENAAVGAGGALAVSDLSDEDSVLRNLWVQGNSAGAEGGGVAVTGSRSALVLANSDLLDNDAGGEGGGLYLGAADATGTWAWGNLVAWNGGSSGLYALPGGGASVGWSTAYANRSGQDLDLDAGEDAGGNETADPRWGDFDPDRGPEAQDLALQAGSPAIDSGPRPGPGQGPAAVESWDDLDGSRNDRGLTGGQGATP